MLLWTASIIIILGATTKTSTIQPNFVDAFTPPVIQLLSSISSPSKCIAKFLHPLSNQNKVPRFTNGCVFSPSLNTITTAWTSTAATNLSWRRTQSNTNTNSKSSSSSSSSSLLSSIRTPTAPTESNINDEDMNQDETMRQSTLPVPVTLLAGFLGTGKTTVLKHLLENKDNLRIGVIVNDVASVNIDAKLIERQQQQQQQQTGSGTTSTTTSTTTTTTANNDDAITTTFVELQNGCVCCSLVDELFLSVEKLVLDRKGMLDAIVIELSGVSDALSMKNTWTMAPLFVQNVATLSKIVTIIDAGTFGIDYMTWDTTVDREKENENNSNSENGPTPTTTIERKISELLAEQVEAADVILINKIDLADNEQIHITKTVARALNPDAQLELVHYGKIEPSVLIGSTGDGGLPKKLNQVQEEGKDYKEEHHDDHDHHTTHVEIDTTTSTTNTAVCTEPTCTDPSHTHSHDEHDHDHHDDNHSHSHSHDHATNNKDTTNNDIGIQNFVYKATRPFNPSKLMKVLNRWPVPIKDTLDIELLQNAIKSGYEIKGKRTGQISPFVGVLRSKGFCWFAPYEWIGPSNDSWRHDTAMYWSHAGRQFGISAAGKWWGTLSKEQMKQYFTNNNMKEYERIVREDFVTNEFGDRRQELVFIGTNLNETLLCNVLNECLLNDDEMDQYRKHVSSLHPL